LLDLEEVARVLLADNAMGWTGLRPKARKCKKSSKRDCRRWFASVKLALNSGSGQGNRVGNALLVGSKESKKSGESS
jgi:hypothetical protein